MAPASTARRGPSARASDRCKASNLDVAVAKPLVDNGVYHLVADQDMLTELQKLGQWLKDVGQLKTSPTTPNPF